MRPITTLLFILAIKLNLFSQTNKQKCDRDKMDLKGDVESIVERSSSKDSFGNEFKDENTYIFNKKGNLTEEIFYTNNKYSSKIIHEYNPYDNDNKMRKHFFPISPNNPTTTISYLYDSNQNLVEEYSNHGDKVKYKYDEKGNNIEITNYNSDGTLKSKENYKYDNFGNKIETITLSLGNRVFNEPDRKTKSISKYDNRGFVLETTHYDNQEIIIKIVYKYDVNGNLVEDASFSKTGKLESKRKVQYVYDNHQNWIKKVTYSGSVQMANLTRKISYVNTTNLKTTNTPVAIPPSILALRKLHNSDLMAKLFNNPVVRLRLLKLLGKERLQFMESHWSLGTSIKVEDDVLYVSGCMSHFCMETNFIIIIDTAQNIFHVGVRDNEKIKIYSESDINTSTKSKERMEHWKEFGSDGN